MSDGGKKSSDLSQAEIETKLKSSFTGISNDNITILSTYMKGEPKKWRIDTDEHFIVDVNKIMPDAFAYNMRPSNMLLGGIIALLIVIIVGALWWIISTFVMKNNKNVIDDPMTANTNYI
jgi:hypothetical protein